MDLENVNLKKGNRVCFCVVDGVHKARVYAGASKRKLGEFDHPQNLTNQELEILLRAKAKTQDLAIKRAPYVGCNFYVIASSTKED